MNTGFSSLKDVLEVAVVPVSLALIALFWPSIQSWARRRAFRRLIQRELREIAPYPETPIAGGSWVDHQRKDFIHRQIFANVSDNRDFILSLSPDLVYLASQLWSARQHKDGDQWLYYVQQLSAPTYDSSGEVKEAYESWQRLIIRYRKMQGGDYSL